MRQHDYRSHRQSTRAFAQFRCTDDVALGGQYGGPKKTVFITDVSTGIGYGAAREFSKQGYRVIGTIRQERDATLLREECGENFFPFLLDVTDQKKTENLPEALRQQFGELHLNGLINNAGIAKAGPIQYQELSEIREQFEVNFFGMKGRI